MTCSGGNDGSIRLLVDGGNNGYTFTWEDDFTGPDRFDLAAGDYPVTVTDADDCPTPLSFTVGGPDEVDLTCQTTANQTTFGGNGSIEIDITGGTGPWFVRANGNFLRELTAADLPFTLDTLPGNYDFSVTDANGCTTAAPIACSARITELGCDPVTVTSNIEDVTCSGGNDGSIRLLVDGGNNGYTFTWEDDFTGPDRFDLAAGDYPVTVTDADDCPTPLSFMITQPEAVAVSCNVTEIDSFGGTAEIEFTLSGGTAPYTVVSNGDTLTEAAGASYTVEVSAGSYTILITDANGCTDPDLDINCTVFDIEEFDCPVLMLSDVVVTNPSCPDAEDGSIGFDIAGGTPPYTALWSLADRTDLPLTGIGAGLYGVLITDANGCTVEDEWQLSDPELVTVSCETVSDPTEVEGEGTMAVTVTGGIPPYDLYLNGDLFQTVTEAGETLSIDTTAGNYTFEVRSGAACLLTDLASCTTTLQEPGCDLVVNLVQTDSIRCFGDATARIEARVTGGSGNYAYVWSDNVPGGAERINLPAGSYGAVVTDLTTNCTITVPAISVAQPALLELVCTPGEPTTDGTDITLAAVGGTPPYTFYLANVALSTQSDGTYVAEGIGAGTFTFRVEDANGCSPGEASCESMTADPECEDIAVTPTVFEPDCFGEETGGIQLRFPNGEQGLTFNWNTGSGESFLSGLAGDSTYTVTITQPNGCFQEERISVDQPAAIEVSCESIPAPDSTGTGSVIVTVNGGTPGYSVRQGSTLLVALGNNRFELSGLTPGEYELDYLVTDDRGCSTTISCGTTVGVDTDSTDCDAFSVVIIQTTQIECNGDTTASLLARVMNAPGPVLYDWGSGTDSTLNDLPAGNYVVTVTSGNCSATDDFTVAEPDSLLLGCVAIFTSSVEVNDGAILLDPSGGATPYTILFDGDTITGSEITGLDTGTYLVTLIDANGCTTSCETTILSEDRCDNLTLDVRTFPLSCLGDSTGRIEVMPGGGVPPYTYTWNNGIGNTPNPDSLPAGEYRLTVTDSIGCTRTVVLNLFDPPPFDVTCNYTAPPQTTELGQISASLSGGQAPFRVSFNGGALFTTDDRDFVVSDFASGAFTVLVIDANGCTTECSGFVIPPETCDGLDLSIDGSGLGCPDQTDDGCVTVAAGSGTAPYTYAWSHSADEGGPEACGLSAGTFSVTVTDATGCVDSAVYVLAQTTELLAQASVGNVCEEGQENGVAIITMTGGTPRYFIQLTGNLDDGGQIIRSSPPQTDTTFRFRDLPSGDYTIVITDGGDCGEEVTLSFRVDVGLGTELVATSPTCGVNGSLRLTPVSPGFTYEWDNTAANVAFQNGLRPGTYAVTVTDTLTGCAETFTQTLEDTGLALSCAADTTVNGFTTTVTGGEGPFTLAYSGPESATITMTGSQETVANLPPGIYALRVTDTNGCAAECTVTVVEDSDCSINMAAVGLSVEITTGICLRETGEIRFVGDSLFLYEFSIGGEWQELSLFTGLAAGSYSPMARLRGSDGECPFTWAGDATVTDFGPVRLSNNLSDPSSCSAADGTLAVIATAGSGEFRYSIDGGMTLRDTNFFDSLTSGTYELYILDVLTGCDVSFTATIRQFGGPELRGPQIIAASDCGVADGSIEFQVINGTPNTVFRITDSAWQSTARFENLAPGTYFAQLLDTSSGCSFQWLPPLVVGGRMLPAVDSIVISDATDCTTADGSFTLVGGPAGMLFSFDAGDTWVTDSSRTNLSSGSYRVGIRYSDDPDCIAWEDIVIGGSSDLTVSAVDITQPSGCNVDETGTVRVTGATGQLYSLDNAVSWNDDGAFDGLAAGTYTLLVASADTSCVIVWDMVTIQESITAIRLALDEVIEPGCYGEATGFVAVSVTGGSDDIDISWSDDPTARGTERNDLAGDVTVIATDRTTGCSDTMMVMLSVEDPFRGIDSLVTDLAECGGLEAFLDLSAYAAGMSIVWTLPDNTTTAGPQLTTTQAGPHRVTVTDTGTGCAYEETFNVMLGDEDGPVADFLFASEYGINSGGLQVFEISPVKPDSISWILDDPGIQILSGDSSRVTLEFAATGTYTIGLAATFGDCTQTLYRSVTVLDSVPHLDGVALGNEIVLATLVPTLHDGTFTVNLELNEELPAELIVIDQATGQIVNRQILRGSDTYTDIRYNLSTEMATGIHLMMIRAGESVRLIRHCKGN